MPDLTMLVVSQDSSLIKTMHSIAPLVPGLQVETCDTLSEAESCLEFQKVGLVIVHLPQHQDENEVVNFLNNLEKLRPNCPSLLLSDEYQSEKAVSYLRAGATEYFGLTHDTHKLAHLIDMLTMVSRREDSENYFSRTTDHQFRFDPKSLTLAPEMLDIMDQLRRVIPQETTLLLIGETGTGKTRLARLIHELSPRQNDPFLTVDCGSLSGNLIESEMFGHARGSFTGADRDHAGKFSAAGKGTLLLDEINSLPMQLQSKLLRAVDDRMFEPVGSTKSLPLRARVIAASNIPLEEEIAAGRFRADLFYRLNVVGFYLPPLRERRGTIIPLANKFLATLAQRNNRDIRRINPEALQALTDYDWPGNIRELRNVVERAVALAPGKEILLSDLTESIRFPNRWKGITPEPEVLPNFSDFISLAKTKEDAEIHRIKQALQKHGNNRLRAAAELGISRMGLYKKLHKYGLMNGKSQETLVPNKK